MVVTLAARHALPTVYYSREFADVGGLINYGAQPQEIDRKNRSATDLVRFVTWIRQRWPDRGRSPRSVTEGEPWPRWARRLQPARSAIHDEIPHWETFWRHR
jgi:hypothetical protein